MYIGEYDEYGTEDGSSDSPSQSRLEKFISANLGVGEFEKIMYYSPISNPSLTEFKKTQKILMKRYANVERVKDAEIIGILIGTVVCDNYMNIINLLKRAILKSGKKFYEVLVGKINEPKLKNFQFVDLYIMIACPQMTLVDYKMFSTHVVSPHEALLALRPESYLWDSKIITDFNSLLNYS